MELRRLTSLARICPCHECVVAKDEERLEPGLGGGQDDAVELPAAEDHRRGTVLQHVTGGRRIAVDVVFAPARKHEAYDHQLAELAPDKFAPRERREVVRAYFRVTGSGRQRPCREFLAFARVSLKAGETKRVTLPFDAKLFGFYGRDGRWNPSQGKIEIRIDGCPTRVSYAYDRAGRTVR